MLGLLRQGSAQGPREQLGTQQSKDDANWGNNGLSKEVPKIKLS